ncbi:hypothetical protein HKD37_03G006392 [Glycine soja]
MISITLCEGWPLGSSMLPRDEVIIVVVLLRERVMVVRASNSGLVVDDGYFKLRCFSKGGLEWGCCGFRGCGDDFVCDGEKEERLWKKGVEGGRGRWVCACVYTMLFLPIFF